GDPCTISSSSEWQETVRLINIIKDNFLMMHIFHGKPPAPGKPCDGEDRSIYRRGARRWRKLHLINGHAFAAKRLNRV
ncbi:uncharacterized protein TRIADDRAFT_34860, partial [Trichoplax adhaerens]